MNDQHREVRDFFVKRALASEVAFREYMKSPCFRHKQSKRVCIMLEREVSEGNAANATMVLVMDPGGDKRIYPSREFYEAYEPFALYHIATTEP